MIYKLIVFLSAVSAIAGKAVPHAEERYAHQDYEDQYDQHAPANYKYSYGVEDEKTGDYKSHSEERDGDVVKGEYTMAYEDGSVYTVSYTVDKKSGYKAVVTKTNDHGEVKTTKHGYGENYYQEQPEHYYRSEVNHEGSKKYYETPVEVKYEQPKIYKSQGAPVEQPKTYYKAPAPVVKHELPKYYKQETHEYNEAPAVQREQPKIYRKSPVSVVKYEQPKQHKSHETREETHEQPKTYYKKPVSIVKHEQPKTYKPKEETNEFYNTYSHHEEPKSYKSQVKQNGEKVKLPVYTENFNAQYGKLEPIEIEDESSFNKQPYNLISLPYNGGNQHEFPLFENHPSTQVDYLL